MEIELKLLIDPSDKAKLRKHPLIEQLSTGKPHQEELTAVYFDTPNFFLRNHNAGLRIRRESGQWIQTMKAGGNVLGGLHKRYEWETPVDDEMPDITRMRAIVDPASPWRKLFNDDALAERLQAIFTVNVIRTTWNLHVEGDDIELVLDEGSIEHEDAKTPVSEIELELKSGKQERLYEIALKLLNDVPLRLGNADKAQRGYTLLGQYESGVVTAQKIKLPRRATIAQGLQAILLNCLKQVLGNEAGVIESSNSESLHQMRVGLRRMRTALKLFERVLPCPADLQEELRWLGNKLGMARDWDVLSTSTLPRVMATSGMKEPWTTLQSTASDIVKDKRVEAIQTLYSPRYTRFLLRFLLWNEGIPRQEHLPPGEELKLSVPLDAFASDQLQQVHKRILKRGMRIHDAIEPELHRLRISAKRGRYAVEFFGSLYRPRRVRRYLSALSSLQDELGWRNDVAVGGRLLQQLAQAQPEKAADASFVRGYLAAYLEGDKRRLRKAWKSFRKTKIAFKMS